MLDLDSQILSHLAKRSNSSVAFDVNKRSTGCVAYNPAAKEPIYGYVPHIAPGVIFSVCFAVIFAATTFLTIRSRKWWYSALVLGVLGELVGWIGRIGAHYCPYSANIFSLQISILIIAPCFYSAALYYILSQLIRQYGRQYSPLSAKLYLIIFSSIDLLSVGIQGTGGGVASAATSKVPPKSPDGGRNIMLAGIVIQLLSMGAFCGLWGYFLRAAKGTNYSRTLAWAMSAVAALIMVRNLYRCIELGLGFDGYLNHHEVYFSILDATLMVIAPAIFVGFWPTKYVTGDPQFEEIAMKNRALASSPDLVPPPQAGQAPNRPRR